MFTKVQTLCKMQITKNDDQLNVWLKPHFQQVIFNEIAVGKVWYKDSASYIGG